MHNAYAFPSYYYYGDIVEDEDGESYLIAVVLIDEEMAKETQRIGVGIFADRRVEYEMFMYMMTEDMLESFMYVVGGLYEKILENAINGGASLWAFDAFGVRCGDYVRYW